MASKAMECSVCTQHYNRTDHTPVVLPICGHTFCRLCIIRINNVHEVVKCPSCRAKHDRLNPEHLPPNLALLSLLDDIQDPEPSPGPDTSQDSNKSQESKTPPKPESSSESESGPESTNEQSMLRYLKIGAGAAVGGAALVAAAPLALAGVGFTSAGVAAGSWAATLMSSAAVANGGGVAAGSAVALLQSAGAAGIGSATAAGLFGGGATAGVGLTSYFTGRKKTEDTGNADDV